MSEIDQLLNRVRARGHAVWLAGPQSEEAVLALEQALDVKLPPSFREFLIRFGGMAIYDSAVSGIIEESPLNEGFGWLYGDTLRLRQEFNLPDHLLVIQPDDEAAYCLDTQQIGHNGENPVVCFELGTGSVQKIADNFTSWLRNWFFKTWLE